MLLTLPQEILNDVVAYLRGEERALQSLSLVDRRLTEECRSHLFSSIRIDSADKLQRWCDAISPGKHGPSRYVRFLDISGDPPLCTPDCLLVHLVHLRSFSKLESLRIRPLHLIKFPNQYLARCFGHFPTVRSIHAEITGSPWSIFNFLALFPLLETTVISSQGVWRKDPDSDFPNLACRGDLVLTYGGIDNFLSSVTRPTTCYRRFRIGMGIVDDFSALKLFFDTCSGSLESVKFINTFFRECFRCPL